MHKTSNHSNRIAGRAVTRSVSVIHFGVGTSHSALGMRPDDWYAHISMLWQKDWQKTLGVGRGGRLTVLGESWLPLRLPFCGIQHRDRNRRVKTDNDSLKKLCIQNPSCMLSIPLTGDCCKYFILKARVSITVTRYNLLFFLSLNLVGNNFTSSSQADWSFEPPDEVLTDSSVFERSASLRH